MQIFLNAKNCIELKPYNYLKTCDINVKANPI